MEEDKQAFIFKDNMIKMLAAKSAGTYQEPRQHSSYDKQDKKKKVFYSVAENKPIESATIAPDRLWNVWDRLVDRQAPQSYDETKFCDYNKANS